MNKEFHIIVFGEDINDNDWGLSKARDEYFFSNMKNTKFDIVLEEEDFYKEPLNDIIIALNEKVLLMLGPFEDDALYSHESKQDCLDALKDLPNSEFLTHLKDLFSWAIEKGKNIYFLF